MFLSENKQFLNINISYGSVVTHLRCGGMFHNDLIANLPLSLSVKEFLKSVNIWRSYRQKYSGMFVLTHSVGVNNLPNVAMQHCPGENRTHDLMIASTTLYRYATAPPETRPAINKCCNEIKQSVYEICKVRRQ